MIAIGIFGYICTGDIKIAIWLVATCVILKSYVVERFLGGLMFKLYYTMLYFMLTISLEFSIRLGLYKITEAWYDILKDTTRVMFIMGGTYT